MKWLLMRKIKTNDKKIEPNKAQYDLEDKLLRFQLCHQKVLVNMNFRQTKTFYREKTCRTFLLQPKDLTDIAKDQYKLLRDQENNVIDNNREDGDNREEDISDDSSVAKTFAIILDDIKNDKNTNKSLSVKSRGKNINLYIVVITFINAKTAVLKGDYGFDEAFNIFDEIEKY